MKQGVVCPQWSPDPPRYAGFPRPFSPVGTQVVLFWLWGDTTQALYLLVSLCVCGKPAWSDFRLHTLGLKISHYLGFSFKKKKSNIKTDLSVVLERLSSPPPFFCISESTRDPTGFKSCVGCSVCSPVSGENFCHMS